MTYDGSYLEKKVETIEKRIQYIESVVYQGNYGKNSILEEIKVTQGLINNLNSELTNIHRKIQIHDEQLNRLEDKKLDIKWLTITCVIIGAVCTIIGIWIKVEAEEKTTKIEQRYPY